MPETVQRSAPPALPPRQAWHLNWFVVNLCLPAACVFVCGMGMPFILFGAIFAVEGLELEQAAWPVIVFTVYLVLLLGFITTSVYLNIKACRPYAKGKRWLHAMLVIGSFGLNYVTVYNLMRFFL